MFYEKVGISLTLVDNVNGSPPPPILLFTMYQTETIRYSYIISVRLYVQILYVHMYCTIHICGIE